MATQLPKTLYVKIESDSSSNEYFVADEDAASLVEMGQTIKIGVYQLVEISVAKGVAEFKKAKRRS